MSGNPEGPWLFEFEHGQSIHFAIHEAVEDRDECIELIEINHGKVTEQLGDADFVLFSHRTPGVEELLQDGRAQGKPALDVNWIHRCRGVERIVPWYSFQIGMSNLALMSLSAEARDEHEMVLFMARYGTILTLKQSFEKLERMFPHRSARKFRELYTQRRSRLMPRIASLQQRLESVLEPPLKLVPTKPRLNFSCSAPRLASTFDTNTNAVDLYQSREDTQSQTPPPHLSALISLPSDDNSRSLENIGRAIEYPQTPAQKVFGGTNDHTRATTETDMDATLDFRHDVTEPKPSVVARSFGPLQVDLPSKKKSGPKEKSAADDEHWAAAVKYTAMRESTWHQLAHWKGFVRWYKSGRIRSAVAWQAWFRRRKWRFTRDVREIRSKVAPQASAKPNNKGTLETQPQSDTNDESLDNDPSDDEEVRAIVEYLMKTPYKSDESPAAYWEGFQTSYKNGKSRTAMEWLLYYSRNFQVEKRARELKVDVVLKIKDEEVRIAGNPVEDQGLQMVKYVAGRSGGAEQSISPRRQKNAVKSQIERPLYRQQENTLTKDLNATTGDLNAGEFGEPRPSMTYGEPYTLEENTAIVLYQETHPVKSRTREEYWQGFIDWFPPTKRPASSYAKAGRRRWDYLAKMRRRVHRARAQGIGISGSPEEMVASLVTEFLKQGNDELDEESESEAEAEDWQPTPKRRRTMDQKPTGSDACERIIPNVPVRVEAPSGRHVYSLRSLGSKPTS